MCATFDTYPSLRGPNSNEKKSRKWKIKSKISKSWPLRSIRGVVDWCYFPWDHSEGEYFVS